MKEKWSLDVSWESSPKRRNITKDILINETCYNLDVWCTASPFERVENSENCGIRFKIVRIIDDGVKKVLYSERMEVIVTGKWADIEYEVGMYLYLILCGCSNTECLSSAYRNSDWHTKEQEYIKKKQETKQNSMDNKEHNSYDVNIYKSKSEKINSNDNSDKHKCDTLKDDNYSRDQLNCDKYKIDKLKLDNDSCDNCKIDNKKRDEHNFNKIHKDKINDDANRMFRDIYIVDDKCNFLVIENDLMSVTTFCGALRCINGVFVRKNVANISFDYIPVAIVVGKIVHSVLEECLVAKCSSFKFVIDTVRQLIIKYAADIYGCNKSEREILNEVLKHVRNIIDFCKKDHKILDVEKKISMREFGLKGIIDCVTAESVFEFKTGKYEDAEHRAQVILYTAMFNLNMRRSQQERTIDSLSNYKNNSTSGDYNITVRNDSIETKDNSINNKDNNNRTKENRILENNKTNIIDNDMSIRNISLASNVAATLYYTKSGMMSEVVLRHGEIMDLLLLRNRIGSGDSMAQCTCGEDTACGIYGRIGRLGHDSFLRQQHDGIEDEFRSKIRYIKCILIGYGRDNTVKLRFLDGMPNGEHIEIFSPAFKFYTHGRIMETSGNIARLVVDGNLDGWREFYVSSDRCVIAFKYMRWALIYVVYPRYQREGTPEQRRGFFLPGEQRIVNEINISGTCEKTISDESSVSLNNSLSNEAINKDLIVNDESSVILNNSLSNEAINKDLIVNDESSVSLNNSLSEKVNKDEESCEVSFDGSITISSEELVFSECESDKLIFSEDEIEMQFTGNNVKNKDSNFIKNSDVITSENVKNGIGNIKNTNDDIILDSHAKNGIGNIKNTNDVIILDSHAKNGIGNIKENTVDPTNSNTQKLHATNSPRNLNSLGLDNTSSSQNSNSQGLYITYTQGLFSKPRIAFNTPDKNTYNNIGSDNNTYSNDHFNYKFDNTSLETNGFCIPIPECFYPEFARLNDDQKGALFEALNCKFYKVVHGMPGTGKSTLIALLIKILSYYNKKVLIICYTHLAIENIIEKLGNLPHYRANYAGKKTRITKDIGKYSCKDGSKYTDTEDGSKYPVAHREDGSKYTDTEDGSKYPVAHREYSSKYPDTEDGNNSTISEYNNATLTQDDILKNGIKYNYKDSKFYINNSFNNSTNINSNIGINDSSNIAKRIAAIKVVLGTCFCFSDIIFTHNTFDFCIIDEGSQMQLLLAMIPISISKRFCVVGDHLQLKPLAKTNKAMTLSIFEHLMSGCALLRTQYRMGDAIMHLSNTLFYGGQLIGTGKHSTVRFIDITNIDLNPFIATLTNFVILCYFNETVRNLQIHTTNYVTTIDKFQGSEADNVLVIFHPIINTEIIESRERLNVALTRAKNNLILIGKPEEMVTIPVLSELLDLLKSNNYL